MIAAVGMVRDEADVVEATVRHIAAQVDFVFVADNRSTDGTREILDALADELALTVLDDPEVGYYQARKMSGLAHRAGVEGAEWVVPFDADELWQDVGALREIDADVVRVPGWNHVPTSVDPPGHPFRAMEWIHPEAEFMPKVAFRWCHGATLAQGNHSVKGVGDRVAEGPLSIDHFPVRSPGQLRLKARNGAEAYAATDLPPEQGAHWRAWGALSDEELEEAYRTGWLVEDPEEAGLRRLPAVLLGGGA